MQQDQILRQTERRVCHHMREMRTGRVVDGTT
jgi:hypothetical protein